MLGTFDSFDNIRETMTWFDLIYVVLPCVLVLDCVVIIWAVLGRLGWVGLSRSTKNNRKPVVAPGEDDQLKEGTVSHSAPVSCFNASNVSMCYFRFCDIVLPCLLVRESRWQGLI
jgi:hypothetical protein